jgi:hypothetical protein
MRHASGSRDTGQHHADLGALFVQVTQTAWPDAGDDPARSRISSDDDPQTQIRTISFVFAKKRSRNRQAPKSGHISNARPGQTARTAGAILQETLISREWPATRSDETEDTEVGMTNPAGNGKWSGKVKTVSTYPPEGLFTKDAQTIARTLASKKVSPKGPGSGMRMLTFFINRAGKNLTKSRRAELRKAKELLSKRVKAARERNRRKGM